MSDRITVDTDVLREVALQLERIGNRLSDAAVLISQDTAQTAEGMWWPEECRLRLVNGRLQPDTADQRLLALRRHLGGYADLARRLGRTVNAIAEKVAATEDDLCQLTETDAP